MRVFGWLLEGIAAWTAIGGLGTALALATGDRRRAGHGLLWIGAIWVAYLAVLLAVGRWQAQKVVGVGQEECFGSTCYSVTSVSSMEEFKGLGGGRLVQVGLQIRNGGKEYAGVDGLRAFLVDREGRQWDQTRGVGGVSLAIVLPAGVSTLSKPVFRVEDDVGELELVLTRGYVGWGWLTIGNTDSLGHRRTLLRLQ